MSKHHRGETLRTSVFVADSPDFAVDANNESLQKLEDNVKRQGIRESPIVL